ncbi:MAG: hypothetical protein GY822_26965 [Deltaproteobacteria bacterium]|nr:hypothetical protein [Deltaproteobacteria bacterium]
MLLPLFFSVLSANPHVLQQEPLPADAERAVVVEFAWEQGLPTAYGLEHGTLLGMSEALSPHGFQRIFWQERGLIPGPGQTIVDFNTDTLQISYGIPDLFLKSSWLEFYGRGELFASNLLNDHALDGKQDKSRSFNAGYALTGVFFSRSLSLPRGLIGGKTKTQRRLQLQSRFELRQYFQTRNDVTAADFVLPADNTSFEPSVGFLFSEGERVGAFRRLHGIDVRGEATAFYRPNQIAWGMPDDDGLLDGRNSAEFWSGRVHLQIEGGWGLNLGQLVSLNVATKVFSGLGEGLDDRNRFLVGGENRFVHALPGAGWGEFLVDRLTSMHGEVNLVFFEHVLVEVGADLLVLNDLRRNGALDAMAPVLGTYVEAMTFISSDWLIRLRLAQAFGVPRAPLDDGLKIFVSLEWRILPW